MFCEEFRRQGMRVRVEGHAHVDDGRPYFVIQLDFLEELFRYG